MDSGLGVRWPLSPYVTALAAGALFAFCIALWKRRTGARKGVRGDPSGRIFGGDLDPKKEQDVRNKPGKEKKSEAEAESAQNFPLLALRDVRRGYNYEHLCLSGQFGAIPRTPQRNQTLENPNLYTALRWRNVKKDKKNWQEFNPTASSNFPCIYQQSPSFAGELPRLNARFFLNISPHLQSYIRQFRDVQAPEISRTNEFGNFDVAIKPEILKNKPITRSAVCLALQRQLHKFLEEPFREIKFNERAIQTADISEEEDDKGAAGGATSNERNPGTDYDTNVKSETSSDTEYNKKISFDSSSLWDSGYGEKAFDDRCSTPKELNKDVNNVLLEEFGDAITTETNNDSESLSISKYSDLLKTGDGKFNEDADRQMTNDNDCSFTNEGDSVKNDTLEEKTENITVIEPGSVSDNSIVIRPNDISLNSCDNSFTEANEDKNDIFEGGYVKINTNESDAVPDKSAVIQPIDISIKSCDNFFSQANNIQNVFNSDAFPEFSTEHAREEKCHTDASGITARDAEIPHEEIKNLSFEGNVNVLQISKCSDKELGKYREEIQISSSEENILHDMDNTSDIHTDSDIETLTSTSATKFIDLEIRKSVENLSFSGSSDLESVQDMIASEERQKSRDENHLFRVPENMPEEEKEKNLDFPISGVDLGSEESIKMNLENSNLERIQNEFDSTEERNNLPVSAAKQAEKRRNSRVRETEAPEVGDVTQEGSSRDSAVFDERGTSSVPRQMDRETGERSVAVESTVTTETTLRAPNGDARLSTAVVSRLTLDDWSAFDREDSVSVKTTVSEEVFRPTFEEFVPLKSSEKIIKDDGSREEIIAPFENGSSCKKELSSSSEELPTSPRVDRLKGLINRDEERRARTKFHHLAADGGHVGGAEMEGEWDRLLRDVLASVSELERWERRHCDVSSDAEDAEQRQHPFSQSDSSLTMEEEAPSPKGETPTKVKNLRFKLDPDVFDVPSDDSFYDDDDDESRRGWKKQSKYRAFSSLELHDEPVRLVSVHASVVPAGQKMVARPVGIDLRVRLTEERQSKRAHVSTSPSQAKRRSPVSDRGIGWCQELSPVTENVDWRETFTPVKPPECKPVPNGILKTPSPKIEPSPVESPNPFKLENGVTTNGVSPVTETKRVEKPKYNGWKPPVERKPFLIIRKKFEPDPEAIERITGYKSALSKPPLPPPLPHKPNSSLILRNRAEQARKQYLDNKAALSGNKVDGTKKFQQFLSQAQSDRARIVTSVPDLAAIERAVTEQWTKERASVSPRESPGREDNIKTEGVTLSRGSTPDDKWASYVQSCRQHLGRRSQSMSYLETDIDIIPVLDEDDKCHSTSALDEPDEALPDPDDSDLDGSREDLDDSGHAKSEHELRIERSLRSLPLPDWYRRSDKTKTGFLLGSSNKEKRGWAAAKSLASSTSSLASCGLRRPVRSLRSSRENIPWSRASASPDGPTLSLALAKAFREPYLGWRARTPTSSGVSSSPRASPPSWGATTTDDEANGVSFDGEDAFGRTTSSEDDRRDEPLSLDDTGADAVTVSMDTNDPVKLPGGEDTCDDINNMSMDTCELFDASVVVPVDEDPSPQADTGDDIDNLSTDTTTTEGRKLDPKLKRYSYSQSIYHSEWDEDEESRGDRKSKEEDREPSPSSSDHKVVWIESSFVGSRTTTSIVVLPEKKAPGSTQERPASR